MLNMIYLYIYIFFSIYELRKKSTQLRRCLLRLCDCRGKAAYFVVTQGYAVYAVLPKFCLKCPFCRLFCLFLNLLIKFCFDISLVFLFLWWYILCVEKRY